jgi:hypothetical protein
METNGKGRVEVGVTLNMGNFSSIKTSVSFEETYTGIGEDTREAKFEELLLIATEKLDEVSSGAVKHFKIIRDAALSANPKGQITVVEDDF